MSNDFTGHGNSRRRLQSVRANEEGGARRERKREAAARETLVPSEGMKAPTPRRERVARAPLPAGDKSVARGRRITHGRPQA